LSKINLQGPYNDLSGGIKYHRLSEPYLSRLFNLTVACALPKQKKRFDDLIDKLSQLGVDKIIPMITQRPFMLRPPEKPYLRGRHPDAGERLI